MIRDLFPYRKTSRARVYALPGKLKAPLLGEEFSLCLGEILRYQYPMKDLITKKDGGWWVWFGVVGSKPLWGESLPGDFEASKLEVRARQLDQVLKKIDPDAKAFYRVVDAPEAYGNPYSA